MTSAALTSLTDFALAAETLIFAALVLRRPKQRFSAAWYWGGTMLLLGIGALMGGIDHGVFEPAHWPRYGIQRGNWVVLGAMTFCLLMTIGQQFFPPGLRRVLPAIATAQFAVDTVAVLTIDSFLDVVLNYAPVMLLLLAMSIAGLRNGSGSQAMIAGIVVLFTASGIQAAGVDTFTPLDHNGLYHVVSMAGVALLYRGGLRLRTECEP